MPAGFQPGGAESVVVETASGRVFSGQIDRGTTRERLVVRSGTSDMYLVRPIDWSRVTRVRIDGKPFDPAQLIAHFDAEGWPSRVEELPPSPTVAPPLPSPPVPNPPPARPPGPSDAFPEEQTRGAAGADDWPAARSLHIEASVGKWSGYVDNDGVVVRVYPLDAYGAVVPVEGMLEVDLIGSQSASMTRGDPFPQLARWAQRISLADVGPDGATFRFPYQAWHPEFDLQLGSTGAVHARLSVPGQGVFDDTADMVWVRPYSFTRDRLQMHTGGRFFAPQERTSRGMNDSRSGVLGP